MQHEHYKNVRNSKLPLRTFGIFTIILLMAVSVTWWITRNLYDNHIETDKAFLRLDSSLNSATKFTLKACTDDSIYINNKVRNSGMSRVISRWKPKIDSVMLLSRRMHEYIQTVKILHLENNDDIEPNNTTKKIKNKKSINYEVSKSLYDTLIIYSNALLKILPLKTQNYNFEVPIDTTDHFSKNSELWINTYFDKRTSAETLSALSNLDYKVWLSANKMTDIICSQWCDLFYEDFDINVPLVSQNSMYFLPGQTLEISAGLGEFTTTNKPIIFINGIKQEINSDGIAIYKIKITGGKGGIIPITISYKDLNTGKILTMSKQVSYTVLQGSKK